MSTLPSDLAPPDARTTLPLEEPPRDRTTAAVRRFRLAVLNGPDAGVSHVSVGERTVVGAHPSADFRLRDETVSRFHCEIDPSGGRFALRDLGSQNGTFVDRVEMMSGYLHPGARLRLGRTELAFELRSDRLELPLSSRSSFGRLVGGSTAIRRAFALLEQASGSTATVLLEGETGTGKEVTAEAIHTESARREGPFVVVDCGAIPAELLESELFGHEKGAFTGAAAAREGAFELASGGTLFLDEIGELPLELQPKLLRALDKAEVKRVGGGRYARVDVRVIAATNRDLRAEVNNRRFRSDLYYRLAVLTVRLPPLRERMEDLGALSESILGALAPRYPEAARTLAGPELAAELARHCWPGNVRELRNYLERCLAMRRPMTIEPDAAEVGASEAAVARLADPSLPLKMARERWSRAFERRYLEECLRRNGGNVAAAARAAEVDRMHFYRLLWRHGLR